ncbi:hypothetical protein ACIRG5_45715 [Lentzea sp. NPDC102401]|uniref:hypothetical protein n=1 Tax=Lentzea sp. NPDC102401 TaxID=3364128 RepID=UPI0038112917
MTAAVIGVKWASGCTDTRQRGDHPLFTPFRVGLLSASGDLTRAFPRSRHAAGPPPLTDTERTRLIPVVGDDGLPVQSQAEQPALSVAAMAAQAAVLPQLSSGARPPLAAWCQDYRIHQVNRDLSPLRCGSWWSNCYITVTRRAPCDLEAFPLARFCLRCWDLELLARRRSQNLSQVSGGTA